MIARHRAQLSELLTRYGTIDMLCLDMWLGPKVWPQLCDTILHLRTLQPDVMLRAARDWQLRRLLHARRVCAG